jgi:hypothetical protein
MFGKKIVISDPLLYCPPPLLLRQLKNNQNQTNTTGAQNLKEFNNTAGWLIRYYNFFPKHSFPYFYYHKMNLLYSFIISKILVYIFNSFFLQTGWVCDNFPWQFHLFVSAIHEKHKFKYFKNLTVKVCKIWCNDVYIWGVAWGWLYLINSLQKKHKKTQTATQSLYC